MEEPSTWWCSRPGLAPNEAVTWPKTMGVELNHIPASRQTSDLEPQFHQPGVFVCGAFQGPKDIPQSVMEASAAAAAATSAGLRPGAR
jgi:heterodisulfide reductase subunit A